MLNKSFENNFLCPPLSTLQRCFPLSGDCKCTRLSPITNQKKHLFYFTIIVVCAANHKLVVLGFKFPSPVAKFQFLCLIYRLKMLEGKIKKESIKDWRNVVKLR